MIRKPRGPGRRRSCQPGICVSAGADVQPVLKEARYAPGVCLLFVGTVLITNGICTSMGRQREVGGDQRFYRRSFAVHQFTAIVRGDYYVRGTGPAVCFTYPYVAINNIYDLNWKPFAWFSTFVAINVSSSEPSRASSEFRLWVSPRTGEWGLSGHLWAVLWGSSLTDIFERPLGRFVSVLQIFEGVVTA